MMTDVTRILNAIEQGDAQATDNLVLTGQFSKVLHGSFIKFFRTLMYPDHQHDV